MEVTGEVKVDVLHRHDLRIAAAGRAALHAETGAERRLAQRRHGLLADAVEAVGQAHGGRGLAFAGRRRVDRGDEDQLAVLVALNAVDEVPAQLGLVGAVVQQRVLRDADFRADLRDILHLRFAGDLDIGALCHVSSSSFLVASPGRSPGPMRRKSCSVGRALRCPASP